MLPGLKPEGAWWLLCLSLWVFTLFFIKGKSEWRTLLLYFGGVGIGLLLQFGFAYSFLWLRPDSFTHFMDTIRLFMDWFLAYNPILMLRTTLYEPAIERPEIFLIYRQQIFAFGILCFFLLPGLYLHKMNHLNEIVDKTGTVNSNKFHVVFSIRILLQILLVSGLLTILFSKGSWNPWYFLWLLPVLGGGGVLTLPSHSKFYSHLVCFLVVTFPLFYLPFIQLRAQGIWQFQNFYISYGLSIFIWICLGRARRLLPVRAKTTSCKSYVR